MLINNDDTIAAISTRPGEAAIGIIKLSGKSAIPTAEKIFRSKNKKKLAETDTYNMLYGYIIDSGGSIVDEVVITIMRGPRSYTAEDVVEINCHGGITATTKILEICIENNARLAEPGEFTRRAFLNGRIDLSQAEAVVDLIRSKTKQSLRIAAENIRGNIKKEVKGLKEKMLGVLVQLEASIDFIEEDLETTPYVQLKKDVLKIKEAVEQLISDEEKGEIVKNGVKIAIVGKTNVGKSSLLNLLSKKEKAIVTSIPGTTRDAIEEILYVEGIPLVLVDTAGIRKTRNTIEKLGVERSLKHIDEAELIILVMDGSRKFEKIDNYILERIKDKETICCINKKDLDEVLDLGKVKKYFDNKKIIRTSVAKGTGIRKLENRISETILKNGDLGLEEKIIINSRHKNIMKKVQALLENAASSMDAGMSEEFPSSDLKIAYDLLGEITGETTGDDIMDGIFRQFCIGK